MITALHRSLSLVPLAVSLLLATATPALATSGEEAGSATGTQGLQAAADGQTEIRLDPMASLRALSAYLTPEDLNELTRYLRDVVLDILLGRQEASLPPDLAFKLAVLEGRFRKEGDLFLQQAARNLERDLRRFLQGLPIPIPLPEFQAAQ